MNLELDGKTAFISGSNKGSGEVIAQTLAFEGATVVFHSNEEAAISDTAKSIANAHWICGNLATDAGAASVVTQTLEALGNIDILVNNYGTAGPGKWGKSSTEDWLDMYQKNVLSATRLIDGFSPLMKQHNWGRIIQLGTIGSHQPNSIMPHYYAAKGALATLGVSLTKELSNTGITVNTVSPGLIHTTEVEVGYRLRAKKKGWGDDWDTIVENIVATDFPNPTGRLATRQEISDLVVFLCSPKAAYINGQNIRIDGGAVRYV
jgi:NAD(P)-dependent dehydrogenase (short-subunit alcohol dehydrogenase family)